VLALPDGGGWGIEMGTTVGWGSSPQAPISHSPHARAASPNPLRTSPIPAPREEFVCNKALTLIRICDLKLLEALGGLYLQGEGARGLGVVGGVFTIGIAEEDRSRRWRAHRHCAHGRAVSPITCWVALAPKADWAGGRRLLFSSGTTLLVGAPGRCSGPGSAKASLPCTRRTRQVLHRAWRNGAPLAETLLSGKNELTCWPHLDRNVEVTRGEGSASPVKFACGGGAGLPAKFRKRGSRTPCPHRAAPPSPPRGEACALPEALLVSWHSPIAAPNLLVIGRLACVTPSLVPDSGQDNGECNKMDAKVGSPRRLAPPAPPAPPHRI